MLVFDVTNRRSFENVKEWIGKLKKECEDAPVLLVGSRADAEKHVVSAQEAAFCAELYGTNYIATSAKSNTNIDLVLLLAMSICSTSLRTLEVKAFYCITEKMLKAKLDAPPSAVQHSGVRVTQDKGGKGKKCKCG